MLALIVDDDPILRRLIGEVLADDGFDTELAEDGMGALELLDQGLRPDVIVTDLKMPRLDGRGLVNGLRQRGFEMPVLLLSAYGARRALAEVPADAALDKPFDINALSAQVMGLIERGDGDRRADSSGPLGRGR